MIEIKEKIKIMEISGSSLDKIYEDLKKLSESGLGTSVTTKSFLEAYETKNKLRNDK